MARAIEEMICEMVLALGVLCIAGLVGVACPAQAQLDPAQSVQGGSHLDWWARFGSTQRPESAVDVATSPDGTRAYVVGNRSLTDGNNQLFVLRYAMAGGQRIWAVSYDLGPRGRAKHLVASSDGARVFVLGEVYDGNEPDWITIAFRASDGRRLWVARDGTTGRDQPEDLAINPTGTIVFATGSHRPMGNEEDAMTIAYRTSDGRKLWSRSFDGSNANAGLDTGYAVTPSANGHRVFVAATTVRPQTGTDVATIAYRATDGTKLWAKFHAAPAEEGQIPPAEEAIDIVAFAGGVATLGWSSGSIEVLSYDASDGAVGWKRTADTNGTDPPGGIVVSPDGSRLFVTGTHREDFVGFFVMTFAIDSTDGSIAWVTQTPPPPGRDGARGIRVAVTADGARVLVAAATISPRDVWLISHDSSTGVVVWDQTWNGPESTTDRPSAMAMTPDGERAIVVGSSNEQALALAWCTGDTPCP